MAVVVRALAVSDEEVSYLRVGRAAALGVDLDPDRPEEAIKASVLTSRGFRIRGSR